MLRPVAIIDDVEEAPRPLRIGPRLIDYGPRFAAGRGLYRVFNSAAYRFYRSNSEPPAEGDAPFATSAALPHEPAATYADGTWYLSVSYFNGVLDSGFLPLGPRGETYLPLVVSAGAVVPTKPSTPITARLEQSAAGVVRIVAVYSRLPDGANAATQWAIAYTTNGSTPPSDTPSATPKMTAGPLAVLAYDLPAQTAGTVVKVQLQTRRLIDDSPVTWTYSPAGAVLSLTVATAGPSAPLG